MRRRDRISPPYFLRNFTDLFRQRDLLKAGTAEERRVMGEASSLVSLSLSGRMPRDRYGLAVLIYCLAAAAGAALFYAGLHGKLTPAAGAGLLVLAFFYTVAASVRRLHDMGKNGWWVIAAMIAPPFTLIPLLIAESRAGANRWGENPKGLLKIDDPRLLKKLSLEARSGSVMDEISRDQNS